MEKILKPSDNTQDKNTSRIKRQQKSEAKVKKGALPAVSPDFQNGLIKGDSDPEKKFQGAMPAHAVFGVDPELERQMAAQNVDQNPLTPKRTGKQRDNKA